MPIKAILFDFMGTCLDWYTPVICSLPIQIPEHTRSSFALEWRQAYFDSNSARLAANQPVENFDKTLLDTLETLVLRPQYARWNTLFAESVKQQCVAAWHSQRAWPDVKPALQKLKAHPDRPELFVFANGTVRLQLDIVKSADLGGIFDLLFSSELLGVYKPAARAYKDVLRIIGCKAEEAVQVAAHAYDTRGARDVGMKTVYVYRWTDDVREDQAVVEKENDEYLMGMVELDVVISRL